MGKISIDNLFAEVNQKLKKNDFDGVVLSEVTILKEIIKNERYGAWIGQGDSSIKGKDYRFTLQIPNSLISLGMEPGSYDCGVGRVSVNAFGSFTVLVNSIELMGVSSFEDFNNDLREYCLDNGYFHRKKKKLPRRVRKILCITSAGSTIEADILETTGLERKDVRILNVGSSEKIAKIINNARGDDIIVLYRGGHLDSRMKMFSEKIVLDAIHRSKIPICVALGHEIDRPFVYEVADQTFGTPAGFGKSIQALNKRGKTGKIWIILLFVILFLGVGLYLSIIGFDFSNIDHYYILVDLL